MAKKPSAKEESRTEDPRPAAERPGNRAEPAPPGLRAYLAAALAWILPGAGHLLLGRVGRAFFFAAIVLATGLIGWQLDGVLPTTFTGSPVAVLKSLGALGGGVLYLVLVVGLGYRGDPAAAGSEYGEAFLITAGVMNLLLMLDAWDVAVGSKE